MKMFRKLAAFGVLSLLLAAQAGAAAPADKKNNDKSKDSKNSKQTLEGILSSVPLPELPGKAADLVGQAKPKDREAVALAALLYTAGSHPSSITPLVSSIIGALPESAPVIASSAVKLVPAEEAAITQVALSAAPGLREQILRALDSSAARETGPPVKGSDRGNRPAVPPGLENGTKPGAIRGNRPDVPPGHVRDPKPGRDPQRKRYGSP